MSNYHERTLNLLGIKPGNLESDIPLISWAEQHHINLPKAYLEWAQIDRSGILFKYSNQDDFLMHEPEIVTIADGHRGLLYCRENQGCFDKIVLLDEGDDPPVLMSWISDESWFQHSQHFSDEVFCQIFDWQYALEFDEDDTWIAYDSDFKVRPNQITEKFILRCQALPQTQIMYDETIEIRHRLTLPNGTRLLIDRQDKSTQFTIHGLSTDLIHEAEDELLSDFQGMTIPPSYTCVLSALFEIDRHLLTRRSVLKLSTLFLREPTADILQRLQLCVDEYAIKKLRTPEWNNPPEQMFTLYVPTANTYIHIIREQAACWRLYAIY
jgi:hypothetical protein